MAPADQFPLFRLATLLARQLSKPVADKIKRLAVRRPWFRRAVCVRAGRGFHALQLRARLWALALRQPRALPPLSEQAALDSGADILGEVAVFGLGGLIVLFEVNRQAQKQEDQELDEESRRLALLLSLEELRRELELQQRDMERLHATLRRLAPPAQPPAPPTTSQYSKSLTSVHSASSNIDVLPPSTSETSTASTLVHPPPPSSECPPPPITEYPASVG